jgi:hypothetical protein
MCRFFVRKACYVYRRIHSISNSSTKFQELCRILKNIFLFIKTPFKVFRTYSPSIPWYTYVSTSPKQKSNSSSIDIIYRYSISTTTTTTISTIMSVVHVLSAATAVCLAVLLFSLVPHCLTLYFIITGNYPLRSCSNEQSPELHFSSVKSCHHVEMDSKGIPIHEPCVVRNAVSQSSLDEFIVLNADQEFMIKQGFVSSGRIGNPLVDTTFNKNSTRVICSMANIIDRTKQDCYNNDVYSGFKSLNYTHYISLNSTHLNLAHATRSDIFLGSLQSPHVTAKFHANYYERSQTLQVVGEKLWMLVSPKEFREILDSFAIGKNMC